MTTVTLATYCHLRDLPRLHAAGELEKPSTLLCTSREFWYNIRKDVLCHFLRDAMITKECCACGLVKTADEFGKDKRTPTGLKSRCKACEREYMKSWQSKNKNHLAEYMREFRKSHADELREWRIGNYRGERKRKHIEYNKRYRDENKERRAEDMRQRREDDPEKYKEISRRSYHKNKSKRQAASKLAYQANVEDRKQSAKEYRKANPDRVTKWNRERRVREANVPGHHTLEQWQTLCSFFKGICPACNKRRKLTIDHIIPISHPKSSDWITNIQPLCASCNSSKHHTGRTDYRPEHVKQWAAKQIKK